MSTVLPVERGRRGNDRMIVRFTSITSMLLIIARLSESNTITVQIESVQYPVSACIIARLSESNTITVQIESVQYPVSACIISWFFPVTYILVYKQ
jgi:hypothetical protein